MTLYSFKGLFITLSYLFGSNLFAVSNSIVSNAGSRQWVLSDGKILVLRNDAKTEQAPGDVALIRLDSSGKLDTTFGKNGRVIVNSIPFDFYLMEPPQLFVNEPDSITIYGKTNETEIENRRWVIRRYSLNGELIKEFGDYGTLTIPPHKSINQEVIFTTESGMIYLAGTDPEDPSAIITRRWTIRGRPDSTYADEGIGNVSLPSFKDVRVKRLIQLKDGKFGVFISMHLFNKPKDKRSVALVTFTDKGLMEEQGSFVLRDDRLTHAGFKDVVMDGDHLYLLGQILENENRMTCFVTKIDPKKGIDAEFADKGIRILDRVNYNSCDSLIVGKDKEIYVSHRDYSHDLPTHSGIFSLDANGKFRTDFGKNRDGYIFLFEDYSKFGNFSIQKNGQVMFTMSLLYFENEDGKLHPALMSMDQKGDNYGSFGENGVLYLGEYFGNTAKK